MDSSLCKIHNGKDNFELGIFCKINYKRINICVLITTNLILNKIKNESLDINFKNENIHIKLGKTIYINKNDDIVIIEIKNENNNINYIELDNNVYNREKQIYDNNESIYAIHYNTEEKNIVVSFGTINYLMKSDIRYSCYIKSDKKIIPIFNLSNNNLICLHKFNSKYYNKGIFLRYMINEFIKNYRYNNNNEINLLINVNKCDIDKKIYFLNYDKFKELNELNTKLYINDIEYEFKKYFEPKEKGNYNIKLECDEKLKDCSYMFSECDKIKSINFINFNSKDIINMNNMFYNCENLEDINLLSFETKQVTNISRMFYGCKSLKYLDLSSFDITKVFSIDEIFYNCFNLENLILYPLDIINALNINNNFYGCNKLKLNKEKKNEKIQNDEFEIIKDISSLDIKNLLDKKEYIIVFFGSIRKKDKYSYLLEKIKKQYNNKKKNKIIVRKNKEQYIILNLIDGNEILKIKNYVADSIILEYDIEDNKSFENVKYLCSNHVKYNNNLIYLIGINFKNNNIIKDNENDAKKFSDLNKIKYISISSKDDDEIKNILNNLLVNLEKSSNKIFLNFERKEKYIIFFFR